MLDSPYAAGKGGTRTLAYLYFVSGKEVGSGMEHIRRMCGIVVGVRRMIIGFNNLKPRSQRCVGAL